MITNAKFTSSFKVLAHADEAQIPWGVVRLEIREEKAVWGDCSERAECRRSRRAGWLSHRESKLFPLP
jgi:hypothetical protein